MDVGDSYLLFAYDSPRHTVECSPVIRLSEANLDNVDSSSSYDNDIANQLRFHLYPQETFSGISYNNFIIGISASVIVLIGIMSFYFLKRKKLG